MVRWPSDRPRQQIGDPSLQEVVLRQPYCVFDPLSFEVLVDIGVGEARVGPEIETSLKEKLIKFGARVVSHGRYVAFQMAEVAIPKNLFADILRIIAELRPPPDPTPA
jgi:hypothetical protein